MQTRLILFTPIAIASLALIIQHSLHATTYNIPPDPWPIVDTGGNHGKVVVDNGDILNVLPGASLGVFQFFPLELSTIEVRTGGQINVSAGNIDPKVTIASGASANFTGGTVQFGFDGAAGSSITLSGTLFGFPSTANGSLQMTAGSYGNILIVGGTASFTGGSVAFLDVRPGADVSIANSAAMMGVGMSDGHLAISGGQIQFDLTVHNGAVDVTGGLIGGGPVALHGGTMNLVGTEFFLNGVPVPGLFPGVAVPVLARGVTLTGTLRDGSPISLDLNATPGSGDYFAPTVLLTVRQVPEPKLLVLVALGSLLLTTGCGARVAAA